MNGSKPTVDEIVADADAARQKLAELDHVLQQEIDAIDFKAFRERRDPTPEETEQRKKLRATQAEVGEAFKVLAFATAQRLDDSAEASHLLRQMQVINAGLKDDLERLGRIEKFAKISAQVADALAKAADKLVDVATKGLV